jgi:class 3 adenylate cyclase
MNAADQRLVEAAGSTVLIQQANDAAVLAGASGVTAVERRTNTIGTETFSATSRVPFERLDWFLVSEVDVESAEGDLDEFEEFLVIGTATFIVALAFLAVIWANQTVRPVRDIAERLASRDSSGTIEVPTRSPIEFHRLAESFESMSTALQDQQADLAQARTDRLGLLRRMLPPTVAARLEDGDLRSMDEVPQATVVVLVVAGLSELVAVDGKRENLAMLDELVAELDGLAERHGLERVKVLGDSYFAACGHDRPLIDHAPRATAFASDARDAVRDLGSAVAGNLDTAIGIHTGPVTVGITGGRRMLYDVWGATVSSAHLLARQARPSQTLVSEETRNMLPETVRLDRVEGAEVNAWSVSDEETEGAV